MAAPTRLVTEEMLMAMYKKAESYMLLAARRSGTLAGLKRLTNNVGHYPDGTPHMYWGDEDSYIPAISRLVGKYVPTHVVEFFCTIAMAANGILYVSDFSGTPRFDADPVDAVSAIVRMLSTAPTDEFYWNKPSVYRFLVRVLPATEIERFIQASGPPYNKEMKVAYDDMQRRNAAPPPYSSRSSSVAVQSTAPPPMYSSFQTNADVLGEILDEFDHLDKESLKRKLIDLRESLKRQRR